MKISDVLIWSFLTLSLVGFTSALVVYLFSGQERFDMELVWFSTGMLLFMCAALCFKGDIE